ncbi:hypothetical protein E5288_WYG003701 [Bos mutus]|uniref:Uncharacterized protein n=1 Tax=Bos mutus TaxID=72004 RepID=A0A6B0SGA5_9CETA|nr:hypothetical protein [Bos mutus]
MESKSVTWHFSNRMSSCQPKTREQTESPRAGPHPRPGPGTPSPAPLPRRDPRIPARSRGCGQARRSEQRRAARSRRCSEVTQSPFCPVPGPSSGFQRPPQPCPGLDGGSTLVMLNGE